METGALLICEARTVDGKQRKYYRIAPEGLSVLESMKEKIKELYQEVIEHP